MTQVMAVTFRSSQSQGTDRLWTQKTLDRTKLSLPLPSHLVNCGALGLVPDAANLHPSPDWGGRGPQLLTVQLIGQEKAWAPDSRAAAIMSNACRFLPGPSPPCPVLLGAVCGPWLQGLINSGLAQRFEIAG